ncbi:GNAT family N-acetyltransferase [Colwellia sp. MB3u-70]|uniref:GNAT family N-acetyltransferase n=1 Tax=unclassified Colwellia TaxID=196834 RepID=UPI0015F6A926|nr:MULTISPECIES: GNAT family protein [unclassified Colwellia]MBA6293781.1 GNAT family N-acetyltransferase [Colwellia sp. MB3u-8]MBA6306729.1 GNAT family N-acetyltransferase [Colwellia sp. MB3u-70]
MQISGSKIKLRLLDRSDWELFKLLNTCPQIMEHVYEPFSIEETEERFKCRIQPWNDKSDQWLSLTIEEIDSGEKLGSIGLKITDHKAKIAEVGYLLKTEAHGKGFATEALTLIKSYAFTTLNLNKLVGRCSSNNIGSYKVLEKVGFSREGCLKQNSIINNKYSDDYVYGLCFSAL